MNPTPEEASDGERDDLRAQAEDVRRELPHDEKDPEPATEVMQQRVADQRLEAAQETARQEIRARRRGSRFEPEEQG